MTGTIPVDVVIMTRNEAANLPACLRPLRPFRQVFVVDSHSDDATAAIAAAWGARVVPFRWNGGHPRKKQWCLDHLDFAGDWVLFVDADERLTSALVAEIGAVMAGGPPPCAGYFMVGRPVFLGRRLRFGAVNRKLALLDRRRAAFPHVDDLDVATMWEVEGHYQPVVQGRVGCLRQPLWHADDKPLSAWFDRHNRYSDWEAALRADGRMARLIARDTGWRRLAKTVFHRTPLRPLVVFLHAYLWRLGCLDGAAGLHHALARGFYYWQVDVKLAARRAELSPRPGSRCPPSRGPRRPGP